MKLVRYFDGGKVVVGEVKTIGLLKKRIEASYLRPDIDPSLIRCLKRISEQGYVEVLWPRLFEGGRAEEIVQIKPGSKYFWPAINDTIGLYGYGVEN